MVYETIALPLSYVGVSRDFPLPVPGIPWLDAGSRAARSGCVPAHGTPDNLTQGAAERVVRSTACPRAQPRVPNPTRGPRDHFAGSSRKLPIDATSRRMAGSARALIRSKGMTVTSIS
jgi:hypothetical protein